MSSPTEDLHQRIDTLGASRVLQLLDAEQTRRARIDHDNELSLLYQPHRIGIDDNWEFGIEDITNHPPRLDPIPDQTADNNASAYTIPVNYIDPDATDTHTLSIVSRPGSWVSKVNNTTLRINPNGRTAGRYNVTVKVVDNGSPQGEDQTSFSIQILQGNRAPVLQSVDNVNITLGQSIRINLIATDADDDDITYAKNKNVGLLDSSTGVFTWTPSSDTQDTTIRFTASDGRGGFHSRDCVITIAPRPVIPPTPPAITAIGNRAVLENGSVRFTAQATDPNGLPIVWTKRSGVGSITSAGVYTYAAGSVSQDTTHSVKLRATATGGDPANEYAEVSFNIVVKNNRPPTLQAIGNKTIRRGETLTFRARATDPEGNTITYSESGVGSIDSSTGVFTYSPGNGVSLGNKTAKITATATGGSDSETITITVQAAYVAPPNNAPVLAAIGNKSIQRGQTLRFNLSATDADGDDITYRITSGGLDTMSLDSETGAFEWTASGNTRTVRFRARDEHGLDSNQRAVTITITNPPTTATPVLTLAAIGNKTGDTNNPLVFDISATLENSNNAISYSMSAPSSIPAAVFSGSRFNWPVPRAGTYTVTFTASATGASNVSETITITIRSAPNLSAIASPRTIDAGDTQTARIRITPGTNNTAKITAALTTGPGTLTLFRTTTSFVEYDYEYDTPDSTTASTVKLVITATQGGLTNTLTLSYTVNGAVDYSPNITISYPIDGTQILAVGNRALFLRTISIVASATRYNGEQIPRADLTVSVSNNPVTAPYYHNNRWQFAVTGIAKSYVITASYTDTVNNRAYTTETSVTVTVS